MTNFELLKHLKEQIDKDEWETLADGGSLPVSHANRAILLQMRDFKPAACKSLSAGKVRRLEDLLSSYLNQYMEDRSDWHKWIIMVCLFRAFVAEEPLHPREAVNYRIERTPAGVLYYCPVKETGEENICSFCPARKGGGA
ncbi:MAG: DUF2115 family protein [Eubacterium sp.]|nr:DUF2115 family protein [Eubacterium sp.]